MRAPVPGALILILLVASATVALAQDPAADPTPAAAADLEVAEIAFGTGWDPEQLALAGESATFPAGTDQIYCRTLITGAEEPTSVVHVWYHEGKTMARVDLAVRSSHWRTKSSKRLLPEWTGQWEVRVLDASGTLLETATFTVE